ncbi:MAG: VCBS repeat-containing protein [Phycisphaerae bacterium]|nr:VCBS repeat-containing protein [Phycisphaerae bacterium]
MPLRASSCSYFCCALILFAAVGVLAPSLPAGAAVLFEETFEDDQVGTRPFVGPGQWNTVSQGGGGCLNEVVAAASSPIGDGKALHLYDPTDAAGNLLLENDDLGEREALHLSFEFHEAVTATGAFNVVLGVFPGTSRFAEVQFGGGQVVAVQANAAVDVNPAGAEYAPGTTVAVDIVANSGAGTLYYTTANGLAGSAGADRYDVYINYALVIDEADTVDTTGAINALKFLTATAARGVETYLDNIRVDSLSFGTPPPDFSLNVHPLSQPTGLCSEIAYQISIAGEGGFSGYVQLSAVNAPAGALVTFDPASVAPSGLSVATLRVPPTLALGTYPFGIRGISGSGVHVRAVSFEVTDVAIPEYTLQLVATDPAWGTVEADPEAGLHACGGVVTLTATPVSGYRLKAWSGTDNDASTANTNTVTMYADTTVTVEFQVDEYALTASVVGEHGTIDPTSGTYPAGTEVTLTATPDGGYRVKAWTGTNNDASTALTNKVTMNANRTVTVEFTEADCNNNGIVDATDIADGTSTDYDGNGIPDECEDCNGNELPNACDVSCDGSCAGVAGCGTSSDCNADGEPDECEIASNSQAPGGPFFCTSDCDPDCNENGIPDACDVASGAATDLNDNGVPDTCEDCDDNGIPDECDVSCEGDCAGVAGCGMATDCNKNGIPDTCDLEQDVSFAAAAHHAAGDRPVALVAADFDADGDLDLAVANRLAGTVTVHRNTGTGAFASPQTYVVSEGPYAVAAGDLDGDADIDLVVANHLANTVSVLLNKGKDANGAWLGFAMAVDYATVATPMHVALADLDGAGGLDVVVVGAGANVVSVLPGLGDGTLGAGVDYAVGASPRAVAVADLDGDTWADLVVANRGDHTISVLFNNAGNGFMAAVPYGGFDTPTAVAAADMDGASGIDVVVANAGSSGVSVLLNMGNGVLAVSADYAVGPSPHAVAAADLNGDGYPEIVTANPGTWNGSTYVGGDTVSLLLNERTGTFRLPRTNAVGADPLGILVADVSTDGRPDVVTANAEADTVSVLRNTGTAVSVDCNSNGAPDECDVGDGTSADCNANRKPDECEIDANTEPLGAYLCEANCDNDCNVNGQLDVCEAGRSFTYTSLALSPFGAGWPQSFTMRAALEAESDIVFTLHASAKLATLTQWVDVDLNGTYVGRVFTSGASDCPATPNTQQLMVPASDFNAAVAAGGGDAVITMTASAGVDASACSRSWIQVAVKYTSVGRDCNDNQVPDECDISVDSPAPGQYYCTENCADDCNDNGVPDACESSADCNSNGVVDICETASGSAADCNANGVPDECEPNTDCNTNGVRDICEIAACDGDWRCGDCNGNNLPDECDLNERVVWAAAVHYTAGDGPNSVSQGDIDGDGKNDVAVANLNAGTLSVYLGGGDGALAAPTSYAVGPQAHAVVVLDLDGTGTADLVASNPTDGKVSVRLNNGRGTGGTWLGFTAPRVFNAGAGAAALAAADLDDDGDLDLVVTNPSNNTVSVLANRGIGLDDIWSGFAAPVALATGANPVGVAAVDVNGDSRPDLLVANAGANTVSVLFNTGGGIFAAAVHHAVGANPRGVTAADVNEDGWPDLVVACAGANKVNVLFNAGDGTFGGAPASTYAVGQSPRAVIAVDLDGDGWADLATANLDANTVSILMNKRDNNVPGGWLGFHPVVHRSVLAKPRALVASDLNGDARLDLAVANFDADKVSVLLNTAAVTSTDCNANGLLDICELEGNDCNGNGMLDVCEIDVNSPAAGTFFCTEACDPDCNANGVPDACELRPTFTDASGLLSPIGDGSPQAHTVNDPPMANGDVKLTFTAVGDFAGADQTIDVDIDGEEIGTVFASGAHACPVVADQAQLTVSAATYNAAIGDGAVVIHLVASPSVATNACDTLFDSYVTVAVDYEVDNDCDADGIPDECELDTDGDDVIDDCDNCPDKPNPDQADADGNGVGDVCEPDADSDGVPDSIDNCLDKPNPDQADGDGDEVGDECDDCLATAAGDAVDEQGCSTEDDDGDGVTNDADGCPQDPLKTEPGPCGCGVTETDSDGDGTPDCLDGCPHDGTTTDPCGFPADTDDSNHLSINEATGYGAAWRAGSVWSRPPNPIPIDYVTRAGFLWRSGESYTYVAGEMPPLCWQPAASATSVSMAVGAVDAERSIVAEAGDAETYRVEIDVTSSVAMAAWAVTETPPQGWRVDAVSAGGTSEPEAGAVRWGPFLDGRPRTLSYTIVRSEAGAAEPVPSGILSVDGVSATVGGEPRGGGAAGSGGATQPNGMARPGDGENESGGLLGGDDRDSDDGRTPDDTMDDEGPRMAAPPEEPALDAAPDGEGDAAGQPRPPAVLPCGVGGAEAFVCCFLSLFFLSKRRRVGT